jgi:hypothetical protein
MKINGVDVIDLKNFKTALEKIEDKIQEEAKKYGKDEKWIEYERAVRGIA